MHRHTQADFESLRDQAVTLRRDGLSRRQIRDRLHIHNNDILNRLLQGEPPPDWTRRPNAKDDLRARARELRGRGMTYDAIQVELGCSKSSISLWVRDMPRPPRRSSEQASAIAKRGWETTLLRREEERQRTKRAAADEMAGLSDRELHVAGVSLYWSEGTKSKPHSPQERVTFTNSDPNMIRLFLAWLALVDVAPERLQFRVHIHESADVGRAEQYWADLVGVDVATFARTTLKKHNPKTVRKNVGESFHGCLVVRVRQSADLYRRIEGWWYGIVGGVRGSQEANRT
ncbi:Resolvase OS=Streptomyces rimosus subsp. rimosus (strain ATCC / DSM 40260 / JCM 4667/ NRRL 2234) OX=1265868 GN=SRIM_016435 PE=4 SV=1 [Streptomyces rimosus subsp. rimosus]